MPPEVDSKRPESKPQHPTNREGFPSVSAPSAKRGDSVKFVRPYATPTKKLNLRFFGYFLLNYGVRRGLGKKGER